MTDRRTFVSSLVAAGVAVRLPALRAVGWGAAGSLDPRLTALDPSRPALPSPDQARWQDLAMGMFVHFGPATWRDWAHPDQPPALGSLQLDIDTDEWAGVAKDLGARYVVMVAKHEEGFCMWPTQTTDYGIISTPWKGGHGDVMADLAASCRRAGLGLGVYLSPLDRNFGAGAQGRCDTPAKQALYDLYYRTQLTELLTRYGAMTEVWFDGSVVVPVADLLAAYAPHAAIFQGPQATIRWVGNEDGFAPYPSWDTLPASAAATGVATAKDSDPDGDAWLPLECDVSIRRPHWFWRPADEASLLTLDALLEIYYRSVGRGAQLLLNVPPDPTGHMPAPDAARAKEFGDEVRRRFGRSLAETAGEGGEVTLHLRRPAIVDHVVIEEDLAAGERVRAYRLEGRSGRVWQSLGDGLSIGHRRIQPVPPTRASAIRLVVTRSAAPPRIRRLAAFATGATPPPTWDDPGPP
jgi:alpha-L-fucosidase